MRKLIVVVLLFISTGISFAAPPRQLPELKVFSVAGDSVASAQIQLPDSWLLVYLAGVDNVDRNLLAALQVFYDHPSARRVAVIIPDVTTETLSEIIINHQKLANLRWFADQGRSAAKALQLPGTAMIMGMQGEVIRWELSGSGMDQGKLRSVLVDWVKQH